MGKKSRKVKKAGKGKKEFGFGSSCFRGDGVEQSHAKAAEWWLKAQMGHTEAQYNLAGLFSSGEGVEQSDAKAAEWWQKAAEQDLAAAQYQLALIHKSGKGVEQSDVKAAEWLLKAAEQGHAAAQFSMGICYQYGDGVEQSDARALSLYKAAAAQRQPFACKALAEFHREGRGGLPVNLDKATKWVHLAAKWLGASVGDQGYSCASAVEELARAAGIGEGQAAAAGGCDLLRRCAACDKPGATNSCARCFSTAASATRYCDRCVHACA